MAQRRAGGTSSSTRPRLVLLGRQGSGKGTQATRLAAHLGVPHRSTGDLFRAEVRAGTALGREVDHLLRDGLLVPDDLVLDVVRADARRGDWEQTGFILDGFPRTVAQAEAFFGGPHIDLDLASGAGFDAAVVLDVPQVEVRRRLRSRRVCPACGAIATVADPATATVPCPRGDGTAVRRDDDSDEAIDRRLALYERETGPLQPWFASWGRLVVVDGLGAPDAVFARLVAALDPFVDLTTSPPR